MHLILEATMRTVDIVDATDRRVPARIWQGSTEDGIPVLAVIPILVPLLPTDDPRQARFEMAREGAPLAYPRPEVATYSAEVML